MTKKSQTNGGIPIPKSFNFGDLKKAVKINPVALTLDGETGRIFCRQFSTATRLRLMELQQTESPTPVQAREIATALADGIASTLVSEDGAPLMSVEEAFELPFETLGAIFAAIAAAGGGDEAGNASGEAEPSASPTD